MSRADEREVELFIEAELGACRGRTVFVDGFNVLHAAILTGRRGRDWWSAPSRERLLARVAGWPEGEDDLWVVFDGAGPGWSVRIGARETAAATPAPSAQSAQSVHRDVLPPGPRVHVVFAASADDWIVRRARRASDPARVVVVSADRQVAGRARSAGCEVLPPRAFAGRCASAVDAQAGAAREAAPQDDFVDVSRAAPSPKVDS